MAPRARARPDVRQRDAWDIAAIAGLFGLSNRLANATDMRPNPEFYTMGRVPRQK